MTHSSPAYVVWDDRRMSRAGPGAIASRQQARLAELVASARAFSPYYRRLYRGLPASEAAGFACSGLESG